MPNEVGGIRRRIVGAKEVAERMNRVKFRHVRSRLVKEQLLLRRSFDDDENEEEEAIFW